MAITPNSSIKLLKLPPQINNKNQISFKNADEQFNYFNSLASDEMKFSSYQRKDNVIRWDDHIDNIMDYNYVMYQNDDDFNAYFGDKWFYAFIVDMKYSSNSMTEIKIKTDVFQTWQFDVQYLDSFIEREHVAKAEDIAGNNLIPEGLENGEIIVNSDSEVDRIKTYLCTGF